MLSRNHMCYFIRPVNLLLNACGITEMQEKDNVRIKNYKTEDGINIVRKKGYRKIVVAVSSRKKIVVTCFR